MVGLTIQQIESWAEDMEEKYKDAADEEIALALCTRAYNEGLRKSIEIIESYRVSVGNSPAGERAAEWTMENLREIREEIREIISELKSA